MLFRFDVPVDYITIALRNLIEKVAGEEKVAPFDGLHRLDTNHLHFLHIPFPLAAIFFCYIIITSLE